MQLFGARPLLSIDAVLDLNGTLRGKQRLQSYPRIGEVIELVLDIAITFCASPALGRWRRSPDENLGSQHIELRGFVDRFKGIAAEYLVAPRNQILQILEHHGELVGTQAV